ncbi:MAG: hypothetical protein N2560_10115, partial [Ignavibacteria bacterium]|nr:hypothetical protein [Ignavibacteria bacterium]
MHIPQKITTRAFLFAPGWLLATSFPRWKIFFVDFDFFLILHFDLFCSYALRGGWIYSNRIQQAIAPEL